MEKHSPKRNLDEDEEIEQLLHEIDLLLRHIVFRLHHEDPRVFKNHRDNRRADEKDRDIKRPYSSQKRNSTRTQTSP